MEDRLMILEIKAAYLEKAHDELSSGRARVCFKRFAILSAQLQQCEISYVFVRGQLDSAIARTKKKASALLRR